MKSYTQRKKQLEKEVQLWQKEKELIIIRQNLQEEKKQIRNKRKSKKKKMAMSKFLMLFLFASCSIVEIFTLYATVKCMNMGQIDFSPLQSLIAAIITETVGYAVYSLKSMKQNTSGGIVYETALLEYKNNQIEEAQG